MKVICVFLLIAIACSFRVRAPSPPFWGGNPKYTVNITLMNDNPKVTWNFTYYYDSTLKAERYEHQAPQTDEMCWLAGTAFKNDTCTITFATDGWSYIEYPTHNFCCKCENSFGYISYDWIQANSTYVGVETVNKVATQHWTKMGAYLNNYYVTVDKQLPVRFFEIKKGNPKSWDFDLNSYSTGPINPDKFKAPCTKRCVGECMLFSK